MIGRTVGRYKILRRLGRAAVGDRYEAEDTARGRSVALTIGHSDSSESHGFRKRAQAVAALSHPNLKASKDFGQDGGIAYVVTEPPEGRVLRERLQEGRLSPVEAVEYARQIAEGIAAAHARELAHLHLNPENVLLTETGKVQVLELGWGEVAGATLEVDTVRYRAPEQVRGTSGDRRSDVFSFGAILHEMLSGDVAFAGDSPSETMAAILDRDPPELSSTETSLPPSLEKIVKRCLAKDPDERFQSMQDVVMAIDELSEERTTERPPVMDQERPGRRWKFFTSFLV